MQRVKLPGLDAIRFYAAFSIVLFHLVHMASLELPRSMGFIATHFGYGVPLFYMVSAFGLFLGYQNKLTDSAALREYYLRRFFRIAPLFYFMVVFYLPFLWLLYDGHTVPFSKIVSSVLFIFNFIPQDVEGFVWASWSIGVEMVFYLLLPLMVLSIRNTASATIFLLLSVFIKLRWDLSFEGGGDSLIMANFKTYFFLSHVHYFAMGIFAYFVWRNLHFSKANNTVIGRLVLLCVSILLIVLGAYSLNINAWYEEIVGVKMSGLAYSISLGLSLAFLLIGVALQPVRFIVNKLSCQLGKTSFSLYLWHPIVIIILLKSTAYSFLYARIESVNLAWFLAVLMTFLVLIPLSSVSYRYIEQPGMKTVTRFLR